MIAISADLVPPGSRWATQIDGDTDWARSTIFTDPAGSPEVKARPSKIGYLPTLDGWRAIAIGLVLLDHSRPSLAIATHGASTRFFELFPHLGSLGVRIFFGISGFLICSRLIDEDAVRGRIDLKGFYIRRFFRIIPPLLVMMVVVLALSNLGAIHVPLRQWLAGIFFAANYVRDSSNSEYLGHLWSLAVEEHFYLIFPGLLCVLGIARGLRLSCFAATLVVLWRVYAFKVNSSRSDFDAAYFWGRTDIAADGLLWGCAAAFLLASPARDRLRWLLRPGVWWALSLGLALSVPAQRLAPTWWVWLGLFSSQALVIPLLLVGTVLRSDGLAGRLLEARVPRWIGRLSYSLYLWQQLFLSEQLANFDFFRSLQRFPVNLVLIVIIASLSYFALELPTMRLGHKLARPVTAGRAELASPGGDSST